MSPSEWDECFLLHQRAYGETSLIAEVFSRKNGKMSLMARGAKKPKSKFFGYLAPFTKLKFTCSGRSDLKTLTNRISRQLSGNHISNKDRAVIILPNGPHMASSFLAISSYMSAAPLNPNYKADEYEFYLNDLKPKIVIVCLLYTSDAADE